MDEENFIKQTAEDYDMDYEDVKYIRKHNPDNFYEALEQFIRNRDEINLESKLKKIVKRNLEEEENYNE